MKLSASHLAILVKKVYSILYIKCYWKEVETMSYITMTKEQLQKEYALQTERFDACKAQNLKLNMARGKPSSAQLDLISDILTILDNPADCKVDGMDARNYGELLGLPCAREYWADVLGCQTNEVFVGGSASLTLMHDVIAKAFSRSLKICL